MRYYPGYKYIKLPSDLINAKWSTLKTADFTTKLQEKCCCFAASVQTTQKFCTYCEYEKDTGNNNHFVRKIRK